MNIDEAIKNVTQAEGVTAPAFLSSMALLSEPDNDDRVPFSTLLAALRCSRQFGDNLTPMKELAVLTLYRRTGRPRQPNHEPYQDFITDEEDWVVYLKEKGLIQQENA